jgi:HPt (histidine-containing phosphotransfer) domain-containing protein
VDVFCKETPERLIQIEKAISVKNYLQISREAHKLRFSCSYLGADEMAKLCENLEKWGLNSYSRSMRDAEIYLSAIEDTFEETKQEFHRYLRNRTSLHAAF